MFPLEKLNKVKTIITHANCPDGMASAILLHDVLPDAEIRFVQHQTVDHREMVVGPDVLFADFSPHEDLADAFANSGALILDHHKTAKDLVTKFGENGVFGDEVADPGVCGAVLVFKHVWLPLTQAKHDQDQLDYIADSGTYQRAENFATLAGIRDTWQKSHARWREACIQAEMLRFYPAENWFEVKAPFSYSNEKWFHERMVLGELLLKKHEKSVEKSIEKAFRCQTEKGTRIVILGSTHTTSDAADLIGDQADVVIGFGFEVDPKGDGFPRMYCSTRSRGSFNCSAFCERWGGGGHTKAAGFNYPVVPGGTFGGTPNPYTLIRGLVEMWENGQATSST